MANPVLVEITRGDLVESVHRGAVAIADASGALILALGDIETPTYPRSSLKPIQALPLVESGAADAFGLSEEEIALACASHSGEPMHTAAGRGLAQAAGPWRGRSRLRSRIRCAMRRSGKRWSASMKRPRASTTIAPENMPAS